MDIDDITTSLGAGSLRDRLTGTPRQPVATFSTPQPLNLDELHQHAQLRAALRPGYQQDAPGVDQNARRESGAVGEGFDLQATGRQIRSALRPGL